VPDGLVLKPILGGLCNLGRNKITSHSSFDKNLSLVESEPFCNIFLYSKALKVVSAISGPNKNDHNYLNLS